MAREPRGGVPDLVRAVAGSLVAVGCAWVVASFVSLYEVVAGDDQDGRAWRYLAVAQVVGWGGIVASLLWAVVLMVRKVRDRRPIGWTPLIAVPLILESWVAGFLIALVLVSI
ncbi:hypothetical protein [Nocardia suismassiliense]|uniref:hypothetical protein n=1 Tax=Nocardia suismassiliense TaxID=2077092 RepID=UPI00131EDB89|nr:hypothetical protein [Nocardia suismassiliense]